MTARDTIAAVATPPGAGGVGVIRVSGAASAPIARRLLGRDPEPRHAYYCAFADGSGAPIDRGLLLLFTAPHSYTGEDVLELQTHGSPIVLKLLLARLVELGARHARPGEFSERAFLNGKLDLVQAEAVADLGSDAEIQLTTAFRPGVRLSVPGKKSRVSLPLEFCVKDNGSGVPEDLLPNLFDPFVTTKQTGSGLGLALVAKIIGDHGGIIECESQPRKTTFRVLLPMFNPTKVFDQSNRDGVPGTLPPASQDAR
jgi:hypothetical protein